MIPIMMVSFAAAGFVLASHPTLLQDIFNKILVNVSDPTLAATLKSTINTAVQQRTTVGLVGLGIALYSGINWMGNLREAIRAQSRDVWERTPQDQEALWVKYLRDFVSLIGLLIALIITLVIISLIVLFLPFSVFAVIFLPLSLMCFTTTFICYPVLQKYIVNSYYEERCECNPELGSITEEDIAENAVFVDRGGSEKEIKAAPKAHGKVIK